MINVDLRDEIESVFSLQFKAILDKADVLRKCSVIIDSVESDIVILDFKNGVKFELSFRLVNVSDVL